MVIIAKTNHAKTNAMVEHFEILFMLKSFISLTSVALFFVKVYSCSSDGHGLPRSDGWSSSNGPASLFRLISAIAGAAPTSCGVKKLALCGCMAAFSKSTTES